MQPPNPAGVKDVELYGEGVIRIYDVLFPATVLLETDAYVRDFLVRWGVNTPVSTAELHYALGQDLLEQKPGCQEYSMVAAVAAFGVPVYTSSPGDSSIGMNLVVPHMLDQPVQLNPILDVIETAAIVRAAEKNGAVVLGGGSPKNFYLQTQPTLHQILRDTSKGGHDYFIQLTVDSPHWGGLSGATPQEARSWGKIKDAEKDNVVVYSCASITFPLLAQYVLVRNRPRHQKELYSKINDAVTELFASAHSNSVFMEEYPPYAYAFAVEP